MSKLLTPRAYKYKMLKEVYTDIINFVLNMRLDGYSKLNFQATFSYSTASHFHFLSIVLFLKCK